MVGEVKGDMGDERDRWLYGQRGRVKDVDRDMREGRDIRLYRPRGGVEDSMADWSGVPEIFI